jgi:hypothetical protein
MFLLKFFTKELWQTVAVICVAVVLLLVTFIGIGAGQNKAQSEAIYATTQAFSRGFENFYNDQDRYPTASEFSDEKIMGNYFIPFPGSLFGSAACATNYTYKRPSLGQFQLFFCLPSGTAGLGSGWNSVSQIPK